MVEVITNLLKGSIIPSTLTGIITTTSGTYSDMQQLFEDIVWVSAPRKCWVGFKIDGTIPPINHPEIIEKIGEYTIENVLTKNLHRAQLAKAMKKAFFCQIFEKPVHCYQNQSEERVYSFQIRGYNDVVPLFSFVVLTEKTGEERLYLRVDVTTEEFKLNIRGAPRTAQRFEMIKEIIRKLFSSSDKIVYSFGGYEFSFETTLDRWQI